MRSLVIFLALSTTMSAQPLPKPAIAESPGIKVLTGLTVPEFEHEMQHMVLALGVSCGFCHVRQDFASEANEQKQTARRMVEMVKLINKQFFSDYSPPEGESKLGKVTCMTCHRGHEKPPAR
jgi:Photosynthetic reaction centre cytochrome C subunit